MPAEWRVLVADDEPAARLGVRQLLARYPVFQVIGECRDGIEAAAALRRERCDVLFLDIQMPGLDGFEVIAQAGGAMPAVVFLTAYEEFALRGFDVQAFDYLVKPVTEARFARTIERLTRALAAGTAGQRDAGLLVQTARGMVKIEPETIDWIEAAGNYSRVWMQQESVLLRESLQGLEERLGGFARAHRRALVRVAAIRRLVRTSTGGLLVELASGATVPVSRRQRRELVERVRGTP